MAVRPVRIYGDPVLRQKAQEITAFDEELRELVADMFDTMGAYSGVGLAANQVGVLKRVFVVDVPIDDETRARHAIVNPEIDQRKGSEDGEEGCLSIPGIAEDVGRSFSIRVRGLNEQGEPIEITAEDYLARAIQHEVDHLNGVLFVDRLSPLKRQFLKKDLDAIARGEIPDDYHPASRSRSGGGESR